MDLLAALVVGILIGAFGAYAALRVVWGDRATSLAVERDLLRERIEDLEQASHDDQRAVTALAPLGEALVRVERQVAVLERDRVEQWGELGARLDQVGATTTALHQQTAALAGALRSSSVSGTWGETQLRRILEHAGMLARCDFDEQATAVVRSGATVRPDVVVRLPGERVLVIDSKAPLTSYLAAHRDGVSDDARAEALTAHARALRGHLDALAAKSYWTAFERSPEMVIAFVPSDAVLAAALTADPDVFERAIARRVVLASPSTLLALLRTVAFAWQQDDLGTNARELLQLGKTLYDRLGSLGKHLDTLGASLRRSADSYNALLGTVENRVLVTARRMHDLGLADQDPPRPQPVQTPLRSLSAPEFIDDIRSEQTEQTEQTEPAGSTASSSDSSASTESTGSAGPDDPALGSDVGALDRPQLDFRTGPERETPGQRNAPAS